MEGRLAVQLTNGCENSTTKSKEADPEERVFNAIFAEEDEPTLNRMRMLIEVELIERYLKKEKE